MKGGNASGPYVGGLVGFNRGAITASYATGASYTNGASSAYGGLVGESSGTTTASYWNTETSRLVRPASFGWSGGAAVQYRAALTLYRPNYPPRRRSGMLSTIVPLSCRPNPTRFSMTTTRPADLPVAADPAQPFRLPDIPEKHPDDMTSVQHLHEPGHTHHLSQYLGSADSTLVTGERYVILGPHFDRNDCRYPDLLVAFDVDPAAYRARNGYMVSEQGKPPDFILEVASPHSADTDRGVKKDYYERLEVGEYWLFDSDGEFYGFTLRGYRLSGGRYEEIEVSEIAPGTLQGYSAALNLNLRAAEGCLGWHDPATGEHIPTLVSERARAERERAARVREAARAEMAEARAEEERAARVREAARVQELEAKLSRLREGR